MEVVVSRISRDECRVRIRGGGWCRAVSWCRATVVAVYVVECFVVKTGALRLFVVDLGLLCWSFSSCRLSGYVCVVVVVIMTLTSVLFSG